LAQLVSMDFGEEKPDVDLKRVKEQIERAKLYSSFERHGEATERVNQALRVNPDLFSFCS
jgi:hypothetical protein